MALIGPILDTFGPLKDGIQSITVPPPPPLIEIIYSDYIEWLY